MPMNTTVEIGGRKIYGTVEIGVKGERGPQGFKGDQGIQGPPVPVAHELGGDPDLAVSQKLLTDSIAGMEQSNEAAVMEATRQAGLAGDSAVIATEQAGIATSRAGESAQSAQAASGSALAAGQYASTATEQAGIATTKAGEASSSAADAAEQAGLAADSESAAKQAATIATTKADESSQSARAAAQSATQAEETLDSKVDKVAGYSLVDDDEIAKLLTVERDAQKNTVNSVADKQGDVLLDKEDVGLGAVDNTSDADKPVSTAVAAALTNKVDKQAGKGLSDTNFTQYEKDKLSSLESSKFVGLFVSEGALPATGSEGDYANVDGGVGSDVYRVVWDSSDNKWVRVQGVSTDLTPAQIKQQYESNPDTNAFTDDEKTKLAGVAEEATKNRADYLNADKVHDHTVEQVVGLSGRLDSIDTLIGDVESVLVAINGEP